MQTKLARFTKQAVSLAQKVVVGSPKPAVQKGFGGDAACVTVSIHGLKTHLDPPYRRFLDVLYEMPLIVGNFGLKVAQLPDFTTVCARMQEPRMPLWREFLLLSAELQDTGEIQAIGATCMDRTAVSHHYAKRTNYTFTAVKTTALIDCLTSVILDIHCSMKQPQDSRDRVAAPHAKLRQTDRSDCRQGLRLGVASTKPGLRALHQ